ncbi:hypothetical protein JB92DRAFT_3136774 [Gautieria morchelliformis]|nr:hypothetical protein JB92DRAFT_3136774 [Gautieria morchelliformis]
MLIHFVLHLLPSLANSVLDTSAAKADVPNTYKQNTQWMGLKSMDPTIPRHHRLHHPHLRIHLLINHLPSNLPSPIPFEPMPYPTSDNMDVEYPSFVLDHTPPGDQYTPDLPRITCAYHAKLNGQICNENGDDIPPDTLPPPRGSDQGPDDWTPYANRLEFEVADFLYRRNQMSAGDINFILSLWAASLAIHNDKPPFTKVTHMYDTIDSTPLGDISWESFSLQYNGEIPADNVPSWMEADYDVWFRDPRILVHNLVSNPDFKFNFDYTPFQERTTDNTHRFRDFMSGNWAWSQADIIADDPQTHGSVFCPIILGSDKTTVSVATGHNEYWPVYLSIGNIHNNIRRAHRNGVVLLAFLAIPKTTHEFRDDAAFRKFRRQLLHSSLAKILEPLKPGMTSPEVIRFPDDHFRKVIYGLGPYIADYPEQALLACIVQGWCAKCTAPAKDLDTGHHVRRSQAHTDLLVEEFELGMLWDEYGLVGDIVPFTNGFPHANINELLSSDILHQLIKGVFKDHLVTWVNDYINVEHSASEAQKILDDIDRRIALAPSFAGLRRFPEGRNFKQWTGDDSKALMKQLKAMCQMRCLAALDNALQRFHRHREVFRTSGVRAEGFNLPRQHSLIHYVKMIRAYGAPNGLCSSITESKHIKAVKEPWRRSSRFEALSQMLLTNQRLDKLAAARVDFVDRGMLKGTCLSSVWEDILRMNQADPGSDPPDPLLDQDPQLTHNGNDGDNSGSNNGNNMGNIDEDNDDEAEGDVAGPTVEAHVDLAKTALCRVYPDDIAAEIEQPDFSDLIQQFIHKQENAQDSNSNNSVVALPTFYGKITVYPSAVATFHAPSDISGNGGMRRERIRAVNSWRKGSGRYDTIFVNTDPFAEGMRGLDIARVRLFFSFSHDGVQYPCALVHWFSRLGDSPNDNTGLWIVEPDTSDDDGATLRVTSIVHLDTIVRAAHLLPVFGHEYVSRTLSFSDTLDEFTSFYVNKYADHHAFEIAF